MGGSWGASPQRPLQVQVASVTELVTQIMQSRCQAASAQWPCSLRPGTGGGGIRTAQTSCQERRALAGLLPTLGLGGTCLQSALAPAQPSPCPAPAPVEAAGCLGNGGHQPRVTSLALVGAGAVGLGWEHGCDFDIEAMDMGLCLC